MAAEPSLLVSLSARGLARAAARAGVPAVGIDAFGDEDARQLAKNWARVPATRDYGLAAEDLLQRAEILCPPGRGSALVYGSGFEAHPDLLARLAEGRTLAGNAPRILACCGNPRSFFPLLEGLDIPHPKVRLTPPQPSRGWLAKETGACGGLHILPAAASEGHHRRYYQREIQGRVGSLLFLADGDHLLPVGFNLALPPPPEAPSPWAYSGAVRQSPPPSLAEEIVQAARALTRELGLVGLNGIDFILDDNGGWWLLELNPRPTATLGLWDVPPLPPLFDLHLKACQGRLPKRLPHPLGSLASAVVYARQAMTMPAGFRWPDWCADRPQPGSAIEASEPLCSVLAGGENAATAAWGADALRQGILRRLEPPIPDPEPSAAAGKTIDPLDSIPA